MTSALHFLQVARQCEIAELEQLQRTSALVDLLGRLIHALQKERGLCIVYLTGGGAPALLVEQIEECEQLARDVRAGFGQLDTPAQGARLFSRIAYVLQGLDVLPALRGRIEARLVNPEEAVVAFSKLVAGVLAVVFEAADSAADPGVSRLLVALFHFMQGKELAGQERAAGVAAFGAGGEQRQQHWLHLIAAQERCFQVFAEFAPPALLPLWRSEDAALERLRRVGCTDPAGAGSAADLRETWFDVATRRMDALHAVETQLAAELLYQCECRIAQAREPLPAVSADADFFDTAQAPAAGLGPQLNRSVLELVQEQSQRLQAMQGELETARAALQERKLVERAKGLLMARRQLSEGDAHKLLRQTAMHQGRKLAEVAEAVLAMADLLPAAPH
ncbi:MAG: nitrate- and nitrite sensing domain-containing protein [Ottowia sp.]|uniref:nitrate- and nitrite sensing domain-containing protein n=1 Tax=unclassified Ottowia TaxID=2645081 RepID=UPI003C2FBE0A